MSWSACVAALLALLGTGFAAHAQAPQARHAALVTPSDTANLTANSSWLAFANSGAQTLQVTMVGGEVVTITLPSGMWAIRAKRVWATGMTVTAIVEFWE